MRRAKIVCTLGPATSSAENLKELVRAGMDVARLNLSHGDHADHEQVYADVRKASDSTGRAVGILVDLQGPKIRTARFENGPIQLVPGLDLHHHHARRAGRREGGRHHVRRPAR